ncbi:hypothetical protein SAMN05216233_12721 [Desulfoluna spongiiphila]|uniref:Uncharacterized protein n=1 Tax=Desulfoluna spongiiphila TaxID=419481 RepID=A0A1G5JCC4_9BACT|nr:hypothetical protein SAMN05216233_12721 [Desulfoluna spongiiphila]
MSHLESRLPPGFAPRSSGQIPAVFRRPILCGYLLPPWSGTAGFRGYQGIRVMEGSHFGARSAPCKTRHDGVHGKKSADSVCHRAKWPSARRAHSVHHGREPMAFRVTKASALWQALVSVHGVHPTKPGMTAFMPKRTPIPFVTGPNGPQPVRCTLCTMVGNRRCRGYRGIRVMEGSHFGARSAPYKPWHYGVDAKKSADSVCHRAKWPSARRVHSVHHGRKPKVSGLPRHPRYGRVSFRCTECTLQNPA